VPAEIEWEEMTEDQKRAMAKWDELYELPKPSAAVLSEVERRRTVDFLIMVIEGMHELRRRPEFWVALGPAFRVRFEDFQGELVGLRAAWRK
jgi:hypothetical protein